MKLDGYQLISFAGLLHDVGKMRHRAGLSIKNEYNLLYCPQDKDYKQSYIHAAHSAEFLDWFVREFGIEAESDDMNLVNVVSYHHKNNEGGVLAAIVRRADRLSSGFEREESEEIGSYREDRLESVFSQISLGGAPEECFYPIKELSFDVVPEIERREKNAEEAYMNLYKNFVEDIKKISRSVAFDIFWDAVEYIYERYTWSIPSSSYYTYPRISLFDHSKTTAAIAQALYGFHKANDSLREGEINKNGDKFLLVQGDFSGIQEFIFSKMGESNKYAAKILRARSFFVMLSTDLAAYDICTRLGLTKAAIIMNAGGKFTLILPNTEDSKRIISEVQERINDKFHKLTFGETRFFIAFKELDYNDFKVENNSFSRKMEELSVELGVSKLRPEIKSFVFGDYIERVSRSKNGVCIICGKHIASDDEDEPICEHCRNFKEIGEQLVKKSGFYITKSEGKYDVVNDFYLGFGSRPPNNAKLFFDLGRSSTFNGFAKTRIAGYVPVFSGQCREKYKNLREDEMSEEGQIKTFAMISEDARDKDKDDVLRGDAFLGILKADIDNLGRVFAEGFKDGGGISKTVSLSRMMDFFFTGWLQNTIEKNNKYHSIYTVFSGGDDLFLIGPFNQIIDLAMEIYKHLKDYVKNTDIHISCGIHLVKPKVPVYQMAEKAEERLKTAKASGKNRISLFVEGAVTWDEFEKLMGDKELRGILELGDDVVSTGFKYSLFTFARMAEKSKERRGVGEWRNLLWKPLLVYQIYRNVNYKGDKEKENELRRMVLEALVDRMGKYGEKLVIPLSNYVYRNRRKG